MKYLKTYKLFEAKTKLNSNFYNWFGNSKVVNPDGSPRIVYHGVRTLDEDYVIEIFEGMKGIGWFSEDKKYAKNYVSDDGYIMKLYLSIKNPFILNLAPEETLTLEEFNKKTGLKVKTTYSQRDKEEYNEVFYWYDPTHTNFLDLLEEKGYDGIKTLEYKKYVCWLPFYQDQIKSATNNNGNYDKESPNINE